METQPVSDEPHLEDSALEYRHKLYNKRKPDFDSTECSVSKKKPQAAVTENDSESLSKHGESSKEIGQSVLSNSKLPQNVLIILFKYFPQDCIVACQRVCHDWRAAAMDHSLWEKFTFTLCGDDPVRMRQDERKIMTMPALRNFAGYTGNRMINVIHKTVTDLRRLDCTFYPPLLPIQVQSVVKKYPKLESITLQMNLRSMISSVQFLKPCQCLKQIALNALDKASDRHFLVFWRRIFNLLKDNTAVPALESIDFPSNFQFVFKNQKLLSYFTDMVTNRSLQLRSLTVAIHDTAGSTELLDAISLCTNLDRLHFEIYRNDPVIFNMDSLTKLKSLHFRTWNSDDSLVTSLRDSLYRHPWEHLTEMSLYLKTDNEIDILTAVTKNAKQLKMLTYRDVSEKTTEKQLQHLGCLLRLEKFCLHNLPAISDTGTSYLSACTNLNHLELHISKADTENLDAHLAKMLQNMSRLECFYCNIGSDKIWLSNNSEIQQFILQKLLQS